MSGEEIWRETVRRALKEIGGVGKLSEIYAMVDQNRSEKPRSWKAIVRRELEYNSSDSESFQGKYDLFFSVKGIGAGIWGDRDEIKETPSSQDFLEAPSKTKVTTYRILRDTVLARKIKALHHNKCQLCSTMLASPESFGYSEAHHIKPLGSDHNGPDVSGNILVLCPNCHAKCDYGFIKLDIEEITTVNGHKIDPKYIDYHNTKIYES